MSKYAVYEIFGDSAPYNVEFCGHLVGARIGTSDKNPLSRPHDGVHEHVTEDTSDGYHTFGQLYYQRMMLFAVLVQEHKDCAWKTWNHEDGEPCFGGGWFLVTIDTPRGAYGYHFEEKYWKLFDCPELPKAKHWDGYTEENANRLFSLNGYEVSDDDAS